MPTTWNSPSRLLTLKKRGILMKEQISTPANLIKQRDLSFSNGNLELSLKGTNEEINRFQRIAIVTGVVVLHYQRVTDILIDFTGFGPSSFERPNGIAVDSAGNVYVADTNNNLIAKISTDGLITPIRPVSPPNGVAVDSDGNIYIAIASEDRIDKIDHITGEVIQLSNAFNQPNGVAVHSSGIIYVADTRNNRVAKITNGVVSDAVTNYGTYGSFSYPYGVAVDSAGNIYVADTGNSTVAKITNGVVSDAVTNYGTYGSFDYPYGVAVDSTGNVYVTDNGHGIVAKIDTSGTLVQISTDFSNYTYTTVSSPGSLVTDLSKNIYVSCRINSITSVIKIDNISRRITNLATDFSAYAPGRFSQTIMIAVDSLGVVYVADGNENKIAKIERGNVSEVVSLTHSPRSITLDSNNNAYVTTETEILKIDVNNREITTLRMNFNSYSSSQFTALSGITVDQLNNIYVIELVTNIVAKISPTRVVTVFSTDFTGYTPGTFSYANGLCVDSNGNVYVVDAGHYKIVKISPTGVVTEIGEDFTSYSPGQYGQMRGGIALDSDGNIYIADTEHNRIAKIVY